MRNWLIELYNKAGIFLIDLPFEGLIIKKELNNIYSASIRVNFYILNDKLKNFNLNVEEFLANNFRWCKIKRGDDLIFSGILTDINIQKFDIDININLEFKNWLAYFQKRFITKIYPNIDAGLIAWDLINTSQNENYGNIGITPGVIEPTVKRDRAYKLDNVADAIISLSNNKIQNGFEFEITNDKKFTVKNRLGSDKPYIIFDEKSITSWLIDYNTSLSLINRVLLLGDLVNDDQINVIREADDIYKNKWFLLESVNNFISVRELSTLEKHGNRILELNQDYRKNIKINIFSNIIDLNDYDIGDKVNVKIENIINSLLRIKKKTIKVSENNEEVSLEFF